MTKTALSLALLLGAAPACHRERSPAPAAAHEHEHGGGHGDRHHGQGAEEAGLSGPADDDGEGAEGGGGGGGGGGARYKDPIIYVDGEPRASFAYNEMPAQVKIFERHYDDDGLTHRMLVCDYFHALGVDCSTIKETQWYSGRGRIAVITGDELRRFKGQLYFNFTKDLAGKPRIEWQSVTALHPVDRPDLVGNVAIYVNKKPPVWSAKYWAMVDERGFPYDDIPYSRQDGRRGVRINVDGVLRGRIKRNVLDGNVTPINADKPDEAPRYRLADFLAAQHISVDAMRGIDLVVRDERVVRVAADDVKRGVEFSAAKEHHGEMMFFFGQHYVPALAVDLWAHEAPPTRLMRTVTLGAATADRGGHSQGAALPAPVTTLN